MKEFPFTLPFFVIATAEWLLSYRLLRIVIKLACQLQSP